MRKILLLFLGLSLSFVPIVSASIQGTYECSGKELETGESFKGIMTIEKTGETYAVNAKFADDSYYGTGIYDSSNKSLSVAFVNPDCAAETGLIIFQERNQKDLKATWTYLRKKTVANGFCSNVYRLRGA